SFPFSSRRAHVLGTPAPKRAPFEPVKILMRRFPLAISLANHKSSATVGTKESSRNGQNRDVGDSGGPCRAARVSAAGTVSAILTAIVPALAPACIPPPQRAACGCSAGGAA